MKTSKKTSSTIVQKKSKRRTKKKESGQNTEQLQPTRPTWVVYLINFWGIVLLLSVVASAITYAQQLGTSVISNGGVLINEHNNRHCATVGQTAIGRTQVLVGVQEHYAGFWYSAYASIRRSGGAVVSLPVMDANLNDIIDVPLVLVSSVNILGRNEGFTTSIRYNASLLKLLTANIPIVYSGNDAVITISGTITQATGILATLQFKVLMGDAPATPLVIDSFTIGKNNKYSIVRKNGEVTILDLCKAGDTTRLFRRTLAASIASIKPNPVVNSATIDVTLGEEGYTQLYLLDLTGKQVSTVWQGTSKTGSYSFPFDVNTLSDGSYFLQLLTPNDMYVKQLIIQR